MKLIATALIASAVFAQPNSNWSTDISAVTLPTGVANATNGIRSTFIGGDGKGYVGSRAGMYQLDLACVKADPTNLSCWTAINTGAPTFTGPNPTYDLYLAPCAMDWVGGKLIAMWSNFGSIVKAGVWDPASPTWALTTTTPFQQDNAPTSMTHDASGNIYTSMFALYQSTDGGATYSNVLATVYGTGGKYVYNVAVFGGTLYAGGEGYSGAGGGALRKFTNLANFATVTDDLTEPPARHNYRGTSADGNATTGAQVEILALVDDAVTPAGYIQRYDVVGAAWTPVGPNVSVPGGGGTTTIAWTIYKIWKGYTEHEYYVVGGGTSAGLLATGMLGSVDGGATWAFVGLPRTTNGNSGSIISRMGISPIDDSKLLSSDGGGGAGTALYFHPGFAVASIGGSSMAKVTLGSKVVVQ